MRAIVGCLLMVSGALFAAEEFLFTDDLLWVAILLLVAGLTLVFRRFGDSIDTSEDAQCQTCGGAGTVYTDEYNDWRQTGPIRVIRELCPSCEGLVR